MKNKTLLLFDIDGTILSMDYRETKKTFIEVFETVFNVKVSSDDLPVFSGNTDLGILKHIGSRTNIPFHEVLVNKQRFWIEMDKAFTSHYNNQNVYLHPNVLASIEALSTNDNYTIGLLTGNNKLASQRKLDVYNLRDYFVDGAFGCDHYERNSLPNIVWDRLSLTEPDIDYKNGRTIIIGDSPRDIECAKLSGIKSIGVATGSYSVDKLSQYKPDIILEQMETPEEMTSIFDSLIFN